MKTLITVLAILASSVIYTSCCKEPYPVAGFIVIYINLLSPEILKAVRTDKNNLSIVIDTINIGELNTSNNHSAFIEFENESPNYIIYIENTTYSDTISVGRKGCKDKIKYIQYKFNGKTRTDKKLIIK